MKKMRWEGIPDREMSMTQRQEDAKSRMRGRRDWDNKNNGNFVGFRHDAGGWGDGRWAGEASWQVMEVFSEDFEIALVD